MTAGIYCKRISTASATDHSHELFIFTNFFPPPSGTDLEAGELHVEVTNGSEYWRSKARILAQDLSEIKGTTSGRIETALEALTDKFHSKTPRDFTYSLDDSGESPALIIHFHAGTVRRKLFIHLSKDPSPAAAIIFSLRSLIDNLRRMGIAKRNLEQHHQALVSEAAQVRALVEEQGTADALAGDALFQGLAEVLNAKKKELRAAAGISGPVATDGASAKMEGEEESEEDESEEMEQRRPQSPEKNEGEHDDDF